MTTAIKAYLQQECRHSLRRGYTCGGGTNKAGVAILIPDKMDSKTKAIVRDKEGPSNSTSGYILKETQNTKSKRHIYPYVHDSVIYNSQEMEATYSLSTDEWIKKK